MNELSAEYLLSTEHKELISYINNTPELLSLLYDMDLLPEQVKLLSYDLDYNRMIVLVSWYKIKFEQKERDRQ